MPDENRVIEPLFGPYFGSHVTVPAADAEAAISEGWARDPYAAYEPVERSAEDRAKLEESAAKAARKWRGEEEPAEPADDKGKGKAKPAVTKPAEKAAEAAPADETRSAEADSDGEGEGEGEYQTRDTTAARRGRPPKR